MILTIQCRYTYAWRPTLLSQRSLNEFRKSVSWLVDKLCRHFENIRRHNLTWTKIACIYLGFWAYWLSAKSILSSASQLGLQYVLFNERTSECWRHRWRQEAQFRPYAAASDNTPYDGQLTVGKVSVVPSLWLVVLKTRRTCRYDEVRRKEGGWRSPQ